MPGIKTHDITYKLLKRKLNPSLLKEYPNYDDYRLFAQGHDFLIYHNFYKLRTTEQLNENIEASTLLQEFYFPEFVYSFLHHAELNGCLNDEQVRLFIGPGFITHHIVDAYAHPYIIYYSGDQARDPKNKTWYHGIMENLLDIYFMKKYEDFDYKTPVNHDFIFHTKRLSEKFLKTLNDSIEDVYGIKNSGNIFKTSLGQMRLYVRALKDDRFALKRKVFDLVDPLLKGTSSFSYNRSEKNLIPDLNLDHMEWCNPMNGDIKSTDSLIELIDKALTDSAHIIEQLDIMIKSGHIDKEKVLELIPNIASTHGLECNQKLKINFTRRNLG